MASVRLDFHAESGALLLTGVEPSLLRHPLFAGYLRQVRASIGDDAVVSIPTAVAELPQRYRTVAKLLERLGVGLDKSGEMSAALDEVEADERRFAQFSKDAYEIWRRQIDTEDFRAFMLAVEAACPGRTFYRKQLLSAFHLAFAQNACNFSVPGAGKTSVVYAAYAYLRSLPAGNEKAVDRLLVVGPLSSFKAWEDEYAEIFGRPAVSQRISGAMVPAERADRLRGVRAAARGVELTLTSYATLASSEEDFRAMLTQTRHRTMMVLDEAHYIKRSEGYWSGAALRLAAHAASRVVLTGTPAPNGYEDLSNLFKFIYPTRNVIGFPVPSLRAMTDGVLPRAIPELKDNIRSFYTRIRKSDLNLPEASEHRVDVPMGAVQEQIYRALERRIVPQLRQAIDRPDADLRVRARLVRLRQASVNPELLLRPLENEGIFDAGTGDFSIGELEVADLIRNFDSVRDLNRLAVCKTLVEQILSEQGKVLVWSYFLGNLERLRLEFLGTVPFVEVLTGATPVAGGDVEDEPELGTREEIIDRFHTTRGPAILIANPQAVGESISLHKACRTAVFFDRDFNAGRFIQSKDRIHRYNPARGLPVTYHYLVSNGTIDDDIDARLVMKERRLADLVDSEEIPLLTADSDDSLDDVRAILDAYERRKTL